MTLIENILDVARWAPSGDNTQTWRFEADNDRHFLVHAYDTRDWCVYDLDGRASQIAFGALLETIAIAASGFKLKALAARRDDSPENKPVFDIHLTEDDSMQPSALLPFVKTRCTQRRMMKATPLSAEDKSALEAALGANHTVKWIEGWRGRWAAASLMFQNAKIRLTMPEAYRVHSAVIEKNARFSVDKIPDGAVGLDPFAMWLMHWAMKSWSRVDFLNRYLAGTLLPRIELDLLPGLFCASHFVIFSGLPERGIDAQIESGRAVQRFWLTAAQRGLQFQPETTPLIFATYIREGISFTKEKTIEQETRALARMFESLAGENVARAAFVGRLGSGQVPQSRSLRLAVKDLIIPAKTGAERIAD
jgi:hypothetical protein